MGDSTDSEFTEERNIRKLRQVVTLGALVLALAHIVFPDAAIDTITLGLIVIAVLPWLAPLIKSLELPGGWKVEFQELQRAASRAESAGLLAPPSAKIDALAVQSIAERDPNLALAGLRIEIEKRLSKLARCTGIVPKGAGVGILLRQLTKSGVLAQEEQAVLSDLVGLLNSAVHGATVDTRAADWAMDIGPRLLASLDERISEGSA